MKNKVPPGFPDWVNERHKNRLPPFDKDYICNQYIIDCSPFDLYNLNGNDLNQIMRRLDMVFAARVKIRGEKHRFWLIDGEKFNDRIAVMNVDKQYYSRKDKRMREIEKLGGHAARFVMDAERSRREIHEQFDEVLE